MMSNSIMTCYARLIGISSDQCLRRSLLSDYFDYDSACPTMITIVVNASSAWIEIEFFVDFLPWC